MKTTKFFTEHDMSLSSIVGDIKIMSEQTVKGITSLVLLILYVLSLPVLVLIGLMIMICQYVTHRKVITTDFLNKIGKQVGNKPVWHIQGKNQFIEKCNGEYSYCIGDLQDTSHILKKVKYEYQILELIKRI